MIYYKEPRGKRFADMTDHLRAWQSIKNKIFILFVLILFLFTGFGGQLSEAADELSSSAMTVYVVPPITDEKILPTSSISSDYISDEISIVASPGEFEPASFVIRALDDITSLEVVAAELQGETASIPSSNIEIRVVKCWYQAQMETSWGTLTDDVWGGGGIVGEFLTPELLLKDDSLVNVEGLDNYLKLTSGEYVRISDRTPASDTYRPRTIDEIPVKDSSILQPVNIPKGTNKQFWITIKVPNTSPPGKYTGTIELRTASGLIGRVTLELEVLPIKLSEPYLTYGLYYTGEIHGDWPEGSISSLYKSGQQIRAEMQDMVDHDTPNPAVYVASTRLRAVLDIMAEKGMTDQPLYYLGAKPYGSASISEVNQVIALANTAGMTEVYFFGADEKSGSVLNGYRANWTAIRNAGGKIFAAGRTGNQVFEYVGDILDVFVCAGAPNATEAAKWHSIGHKIFCYANPQVGLELPETYRRNYGLLLWQKDYDGAMNYAYQACWGSIWNDFDQTDRKVRDHVFAYPTIDGVIDTLQWEGWREGVDDVRYLTTLLEAIEMAKAEGMDTTIIEAWLAELKASDLSTRNLNTIRSEIIDHILSLTNSSSTNSPPVLNSIGDKTVATGELLQFTVSAIDPDGDNLNYSALNLPEGARFDSNTNVFSWTPTENQAGVYSDILLLVTDGNLSDSENITINVSSTSHSPGGGGSTGGGGSGPIAAPPGVTFVSYYVTDRGKFIVDVTAPSADGKVLLTIAKGTIGKTNQGEPLSVIQQLDMKEPPVQPTDAGIIGLVYDIRPDGATFSQPITITISYELSAIPEGISEEDLVIALWDDDTDEWVIIEESIVDQETHSVTAQISHFSIYTVLANIKHAAPAAFELSSLSISPTELEIGEEVVISAQVTNTGGQLGDYRILFKINDRIESTKEVTVEAGVTEEVRFSQIKNVVGTYRVEINGLIGSFEVREPQTMPINVLSVTPYYLIDTHDLNFIHITYEVYNRPEPMTNGKLILCIDYNGQPLERVSLLPFSRVEQGMITGGTNYIPPQGWENGIYTFRTELYIGGKLCAASIDEEFEIATQFNAPVYSWIILGEMIGVSIFISLIIALAILLRRHHLIKRYVRDKM